MRKLLIASLVLNVLFIGAIAYLGYSLQGFITAVVASGAERRVTQFELLDERKGAIVFVGDSITHGGEWSELFQNPDVLNRGIGGDRTDDILNRADQIYALEPRKLFLMIGINDLNMGLPVETTFENLEMLFDGFDREIPETRVYLQSVLPLGPDYFTDVDASDITAINTKLISEAKARGYTFIDLRPAFTNQAGDLEGAFTNDGIHLMGAGYDAWRKQVARFVNE